MKNCSQFDLCLPYAFRNSVIKPGDRCEKQKKVNKFILKKGIKLIKVCKCAEASAVYSDRRGKEKKEQQPCFLLVCSFYNCMYFLNLFFLATRLLPPMLLIVSLDIVYLITYSI